MPLTEKAIIAAKHGPKPRRLFDGGGLYLEVSPQGGKWWRLKYRHAGKEKRLSLGVYPSITLKVARERRDDARKLLASGIDPSAHRQASKAAKMDGAANTFELVAREWLARFSKQWAKTTADRTLRRLEINVFPWLGTRPIGEITAREVLTMLRKIEDRGAHETTHRTKQNCGQIFRYAVATGRAERDPTVDLRGSLTPPQEKHHPSIIDPVAIGGLLRAIDGYEGSPVTKAALQIAPLTFVRPGELRRAEWTEFDLDKAEWRIPAARMKMRDPHIVPLSKQAVAVVKAMAVCLRWQSVLTKCISMLYSNEWSRVSVIRVWRGSFVTDRRLESNRSTQTG